MAALLELEDEAGQEYIVAIGVRRGERIGPRQVMGEHRTFGSAFLRKHDNKLGSYLHVPHENAPGRNRPQVDPQELRPYFERVVEECERVVESLITLTLAQVVEFNCQLCGRKTLANAEGATRRGRISCLHTGCEAEHLISVAENQGLYFRLSGWVFPCQACGHQILVAAKHLVPDHEFACDECGRRHKKDWYYAVAVESGGGA